VFLGAEHPRKLRERLAFGNRRQSGGLSAAGQQSAPRYAGQLEAGLDAGERDNPGDVQTADFIGAILEGRQPVSQAYQALQVIEIVDAIYRSAEAGAAVQLNGAAKG